MNRKIVVLCSLLTALIVAGCSVTVYQPPETKIKAENDLYNLTVDIGGISMNTDAIDLQDVAVGDDVLFPYIEGGTTTAAKTTSQYGNVTVSIDKAHVFVIGNVVKLTFNDIDDMSAYIKKNETNTIVFDTETASNIFSALAKRKAK